jgi:8-amino-7-oxononanoate synthase
VVAAQLNDISEALAIWTGLLERGVYVNLVFPPATPNGSYLLRCSVSAAHTSAQITRICDAFAAARTDYTTSSAA